MTEEENILSFAECMAKLDQIDRENTPSVVDAGTQTDLTLAEIKQMEQDGKDLKTAITHNVILTTYKKETELRLQELDKTLKQYEQTKIYLQDEAKKDKGLIDDLRRQVENKTLTEEQLIEKIRELEKKLTKPLMVDVATQTELTMVDIERMETRLDAAKKYILSTIFKGKRESEQTRKILYDYSILEKES